MRGKGGKKERGREGGGKEGGREGRSEGGGRGKRDREVGGRHKLCKQDLVAKSKYQSMLHTCTIHQ